MSQITQALLAGGAVAVAFGVWEIVKQLRAIRSDLRLMRLMKYGTNKPEGWGGVTFQKGQSGNPAGRPAGIPDRRTALRRRLEERSEDLLETAINQAMQGDSGLMRALLGRVIPVPKPETLTAQFKLPEGSLSEQAKAVIEAISEGQIAPSTGNELLTAIAQMVRIQEAEDLTKRIENLERMLVK